MNPTYEKALATNLQHYMDRGYTLEQALVICLRPEEEVYRVYYIIQEEKRRRYYPHTNALLISTDENTETNMQEVN